jgi:GNAT superfamily N-acetyltransferase
MDISSKLLTSSKLPEAAALAAAAFANSPCYREIMPGDSNDRIEFLKWMFEKNFYLRIDDDCCRCTYDGEKLICFFMFTKPGTRHPSFCDMLKVGLFTGLWSYGYSAVQRLLSTKSWFEEKERIILEERAANSLSTDMIRLERMTVLPTYQGKGVGSSALGKAIREADQLGHPCILATQERINVTFYKRLGFQVVDESCVPIGQGYTNWMMIREPVNTNKQ